MPPSPCPHCGIILNCVSGIETDEQISRDIKGPFSICIRCGEINGMDDEMKLIKLDAVDLLEAELHPEYGPMLQRARAAFKAMRLARILAGPIQV